MRQIVAVLAAAAAAILGALILGEYSMSGFTPVVAGVLFGVAIAEVIVAVARQTTVVHLVAAPGLTVGGLSWGIWIQVHNRHTGMPTGGWLALGIGAVAAAGWVRSSGRREAHSRPAP